MDRRCPFAFLPIEAERELVFWRTIFGTLIVAWHEVLTYPANVYLTILRSDNAKYSA